MAAGIVTWAAESFVTCIACRVVAVTFHDLIGSRIVVLLELLLHRASKHLEKDASQPGYGTSKLGERAVRAHESLCAMMIQSRITHTAHQPPNLKASHKYLQREIERERERAPFLVSMAQSHEMPTVVRFDILAKRIGPGKATVSRRIALLRHLLSGTITGN
eukprot:4850512-Amphidinium_carterae.1